MAFSTRHQVPGSMTSSTKVLVKEPIVNGTAKSVFIDQPANSVIDGVFVHVVSDIVIDAVEDVTFKLGVDGALGKFVSAFDILDGSDGTNAKTVKGGTVYKASMVSGSDYSAGSNSTDEVVLVTARRELIATITSGAANAVAGSHGDIEIHVVFRHF
tara:strand:+ start:96 stop:566 length:471 start_codon:yes stop_codon:yes gene_type:complete